MDIKEKQNSKPQFDYMNQVLEVFVLAKKKFVNHLNEEQKRIYFQEDLSSLF